APDMDVNSLTEHYFPWAVNAMADLCIDLATGKRKQTKVGYQWSDLLTARSQPAAKTPAKAKAAGAGDAPAKPARAPRKKAAAE
ncbi:MAG TPA: hypothetical protein VD886_11280, partial [Herpetosiphonaceae bacterium]|nr:hypothetical protein [Herpetosiphonaceae bacterium]